MSRQRSSASTEVWLQLPHELVAKLELLLFSDAQGRVPYRARNKVMEQLLRDWLTLRERDAELATRIKTHPSPLLVVASFLREQGYPTAANTLTGGTLGVE